MIRQFGLAILPMLAAFSISSVQATSLQGSNPGFTNTLMPQPSQLSTQEGRLAITPGFSATADHFKDARLNTAISRSLGRIENRTGIPIQPSTETGTTSAVLVVSVNGAGETIQSVEEDESYSLEITASNAHLKAATVVGAMHGLATFEQLIQSDASGFFVPAVVIHDTNAFDGVA
jgi:hexosaminidase